MKAKDLGKKNEGKEYKKKNNIDEKFRKFKNENIAYTYGSAKNTKEIMLMDQMEKLRE